MPMVRFIRHPKSGKPLYKSALNTSICRLIKAANPDSAPKSHDMRKYASTLAFFAGSTMDQVVVYTGWKPVQVFINHYQVDIEALKHAVIATGAILAPQ